MIEGRKAEEGGNGVVWLQKSKVRRNCNQKSEKRKQDWEYRPRITEGLEPMTYLIRPSPQRSAGVRPLSGRTGILGWSSFPGLHPGLSQDGLSALGKPCGLGDGVVNAKG
jgi:hypothetical protein